MELADFTEIRIIKHDGQIIYRDLIDWNMEEQIEDPWNFNSDTLINFKTTKILEPPGMILSIKIFIIGKEGFYEFDNFNSRQNLTNIHLNDVILCDDNTLYSYYFYCTQVRFHSAIENNTNTPAPAQDEEQLNERKKVFLRDKEEDKKMSNIFENLFDNVTFGRIETRSIKYSVKGIAFVDKNDRYFVYENGQAIDVTGMTMDMPIFSIPTSIEQIKAEDVIFYKDKYVIIKEIQSDGLKVIDPINGEITTIIPEKSLFGFDFVNKIVDIFNGMSMAADKDNPFGNLLPLMMLNNEEEYDGGNKMFQYFLMAQSGGIKNFNEMVPMIMLMSGDKRNLNDMLMLQMMSGNNWFGNIFNKDNKKD